VVTAPLSECLTLLSKKPERSSKTLRKCVYFWKKRIRKMRRQTFADPLLRVVLWSLSGGLQRLSEELYSQLPNLQPAPLNAFQRLTESSKLWRTAIGEGYEYWLGADFDSLKIYYQQRHLLAHHEGIVDQRYIKRSGDKTYHVGQRIVVTPAIVKHMRDLISNVANQLRKSCSVQSS